MPSRGATIRAGENHVSLNVALYGEKRGWAMTERGASALSRDRDWLVIGPSSMRWEGLIS